MREYLCRLLGRAYEVDAVADGHAALQRVQTAPPDLVLTDVMMPGLDGFELLAALRADERTGSVPVILLSARAGEEARIEGLHAGADAYLVKPFSARDLLACVASQLQLARQRREAEQALRYRSEQYETLLNQAPLGVYLVDGDFRIREVNPIALPIFGEIPGGVIGRDLDEIMHLLWEQPYADEIVRIFRHTLQTGEPYITSERAEFRIDRGHTEYYAWRLDRITLPDGRFGVVCYFRDISAEVFARERSTKLTAFSRELARAVTVEEVARTVCRWARELVGADGAAFIQREGDAVRYVAEHAIGPLWAGQRFPVTACISGWTMLNAESAAIEDIYADPRIPVEAYRPTFVKALLIAPVHEAARAAAGGPLAAVGVYWARRHRASGNQARMLAAVVDAASVAFDRARLIANAEASRRSAERESRAKDEFLAMLGHELRNPVGRWRAPRAS
jgi:PAS domain S-box-containing protein